MGQTKALMEIGGLPVIVRLIRMIRLAGLSDIIAVTGHDSEKISPVAENAGARTVYNPDYPEGMLTSVKAGIRAADPADAVFMLPVDIPLVTAFTLISMIERYEESPGRIVYPVFNGRRGHPPLIPSVIFNDILSYSGKGGLRKFLEADENLSSELDIDDPGILRDMDTSDNYSQLVDFYAECQCPKPDKCLSLLEYYRLPKPVVKHSKKTAELAADIGSRLNSAGLELSIPLLRTSGLLHDIAKTRPDHAARGAGLLRIHGLDKAADITAVHMDREFKAGETLSEASILYLADKLLSGCEIRTLDERRAESLAKKAALPEIIEAVNRRFDAAEAIRDEVERILKQPLF